MKKWTFRLGDAFPAEDPLARWFVGLSAVVNDLILAGSRMEAEMSKARRSEPSSEGIYFFRLVASHYREAVKFIEDADSLPEVRAFIASLPQGLQNQYSSVLTTFQPFHGSFVERVLKPLRDKLFHYPLVNSQELINATGKVKELRTGAELRGSRIADFRASFADDVMLCLSGEIFSQEREKLGQCIRTTHNALQDLVLFYNGALQEYFKRLGPHVVTQTADNGAPDDSHD